MQTLPITLARADARRLFREYKKHRAYSAPIDEEIQRAYQLIAQGRLVIRAMESIKLAGLHTTGVYQGLPKLAICRADAKRCSLVLDTFGGARFCADSTWVPKRSKRRSEIRFPGGSFPRRTAESRADAPLPLVPVAHRPQRGLANYHILWEAEWRLQPPGDPMLLRRIGESDLWLVAAAWDLTEVEKAALATRMNG